MTGFFKAPQKYKFIKAKRLLLITVLLSLFVYIVIRAYCLSFTFDECLSFNIVQGDTGRAQTANNHLLNTWLMSFFFHVFGGAEIILRLPNIIAFGIYSYFAYKILITSVNWVLLFVGISLLLLNPYLLDFFSLARGYGLSLGFASGGIYFLLKQVKFNSYRKYLIGLSLSLVFCLLSAYSNLSFLNLYFGIVVIFFIELLYLIKNKIIQLNIKKILPLTLIVLTNFLFLTIPLHQLFFLKSNNELYFGAQTGFVHDTISNLIFDSIYFSNYGKYFWLIIRIVIITVFIIALVYIVYIKKYSQVLKATILLSIMVLIPIIQHFMFGVLYPVHRTALIFIPLFAIFIYYFLSDVYIEKLRNKNRIKMVNLFLLLFLSFALSFHFLESINLKTTKEWTSDSNTKNVMKVIDEKHKHDFPSTQKLSMSCTWIFEPSINYYRNLYAMEYITPVAKTGTDKNSDFIYFTVKEKDMLMQNNYFTVLKEYPETESVLIQKSTNR